jgi:hypothetical protein
VPQHPFKQKWLVSLPTNFFWRDEFESTRVTISTPPTPPHCFFFSKEKKVSHPSKRDNHFTDTFLGTFFYCLPHTFIM